MKTKQTSRIKEPQHRKRQNIFWEHYTIKEVADVFTDTFKEQITDYLISYGLEPSDDNVDKVIKEIKNIYKK
tara:strand:- start:2669 stop:2884 length:216 start_codon:yes stop_codon:yes gene_type:complete